MYVYDNSVISGVGGAQKILNCRGYFKKFELMYKLFRIIKYKIILIKYKEKISFGKSNPRKESRLRMMRKTYLKFSILNSPKL